jgi:hypothetical protein
MIKGTPAEDSSARSSEVDISSADGSPVRGDGPIFNVAELVGLRAAVEDWCGKATEALWGFRRTEGYEAGSFWKDSRPVSDLASQTPNVTTTARAFMGFVAAERTAQLGFSEAWEGALANFGNHARVFHCAGNFYEAKPRLSKQDGQTSPLFQYEEQNHFDIAHLADFVLAEEYVARFKPPFGWSTKSLFGERKLENGEAKPMATSPEPEILAELADPAQVIADRLKDALRTSVSPQAKAASARSSAARGEVQFERNNEDSAHYFVTLHALRALHILRRPLPPADLKEIVAGAKQFALDQCYYYQRGTTQKQDPLRLAFAGCIYILHEEHVDKDLCLAIIETLEQAQQSNGSWPATHPVIRQKDRAPWHISSHEVGLCLTWLYFQPRVPDAGRPRLIAMMRRYFDRAIAAAYHPGAGAAPPPPEGKHATVPPAKARGWQDDHTRSEDVTVGWANAAVCHFLGNFTAVLNDWVNRCVIDDLGLSFATQRYLIDESVGKPSLRWRHKRPPETLPHACDPISPIPVWPDVPPHAWRSVLPTDLGEEVLQKWTDPSLGSELSKRMGKYVLSPIFQDPQERPNKRMCAGLLPGQPGTRKTTLVGRISEILEWPMVAVPASLIFKHGFENMEAQASRVFWRLNHLRGCVIFFDEFEEFFLSRDPGHFRRTIKELAEGAEKELHPMRVAAPDPGIPYESRTVAAFTTSAMLPRLQDLHDEGRCLIFFATNHREKIDSAIMRVGRIDFQAEINHPTLNRLYEYAGAIPSQKKEKLGLSKIATELEQAIIDAIRAELETMAKSESPEHPFLEPQGKFMTFEQVIQGAASRAQACCQDKACPSMSDGEKTAATEEVKAFVRDNFTRLHIRNKSVGPPELATYQPPFLE